MRPCERRQKGRVYERFAYRDTRLLGTFEQRTDGELYATSRYLYDDAGRLVSQVGLHHYVDLRYDGQHLTEVFIQSETSHRELAFSYDALGRPDTLTEKTSESPRFVTTEFTWAQGKLISEVTDATYEYDPKSYRYLPAPGTQTIEHSYDEQGFPSCIELDAQQPLCFEYDERRRVKSFGDARFEYDDQGRIVARSELRQVSRERQVQLNETWSYECDEPPGLQKLFEPATREEVTSCLPDCTAAYKDAYPDVGNNFRVPCRQHCENVGLGAPPPNYE